MAETGGLNIAYVGANGVRDDGEDNYGYEEIEERRTMMRLQHKPMKQWFNENADLKDKYGAFPLFWQDLESWEPYREVKKLFLMATEVVDGPGLGDTVSDENGGDVNPEDDEASAKDKDQEKKEERKRRRRSRWGGVDEDKQKKEGDGQKKRRSRWGSGPAGGAATAGGVSNMSGADLLAASTGGILGALSRSGSGGPAPLTPEQQQVLVLRAKLQEIDKKLQNVAQLAEERSKDPSRSPSPPPRYDSSGNRTNTREVRMREQLQEERKKVVDDMVNINPLFKSMEGMRATKVHKKIYIPVKEYPGYNFIGLIIGPRGNTQKRMEKDSNCKIAIRGKGSVKEGARGRKEVKATGDEDDDLHVLITGEKQSDVEKAAEMVEELLVPIDDTKNEHKQKQLRELALINGTLRDDDYCNICGEKGHRQWECPNREQNFQAANVTCSICGDSSHPSVDCPQRKSGKPVDNATLDKEYLNFMAELGEGPGAGDSSASSSSSASSTSLSSAGSSSAGGSGPVTITISLMPNASSASSGTPSSSIPTYTAGYSAYGMPPNGSLPMQTGAVSGGMSWDQQSAYSQPMGGHGGYPMHGQYPMGSASGALPTSGVPGSQGYSEMSSGESSASSASSSVTTAGGSAPSFPAGGAGAGAASAGLPPAAPPMFSQELAQQPSADSAASSATASADTSVGSSVAAGWAPNTSVPPASVPPPPPSVPGGAPPMPPQYHTQQGYPPMGDGHYYQDMYAQQGPPHGHPQQGIDPATGQYYQQYDYQGGNYYGGYY